MNSSNIFLFVFIPLLVFISFAFIFFIWIKISVKKYKKYYADLKDFLHSEPYVETKTKLRTVDGNLIQLETNRVEEIKSQILDSETCEKTIKNDFKLNKISEDKIDFANDLNEIDKKIRILKKLYKEGVDYLDNRKLFKVQKNIIEIKKTQFLIKRIVDNTNKRASEYIDDIQEINGSLWMYQKEQKQIVSMLKVWKKSIEDTFFDEIVDKKIETLNEMNDSLLLLLKKRKAQEANKKFHQFKRELYLIYDFANYYESLHKTIFNELPQKFHKLETYLKTVQTKLRSNLSYSGIEQFLKNVRVIYREIKKSFFEFNAKECISHIKSYIDVLININLIIKNEVRAFGFIHNGDTINFIENSYKKVNKNFLDVINKIENAISIDKTYFQWLETEISWFKKNLDDLTDAKNKIEHDKNDFQISYTSKQHRYKTYIYLIKSFNEKYNNIINEINTFYAEGFSYRLKYSRIKNLLLSANMIIKEKNVFLDPVDKSLIIEIEEKKRNIDNLLIQSDDTDEELKMLINEIQNLTSEFLKTIGKKILIAKLYSYINEKYSHLRALNLDLHKEILKSEREMIENKYEKGLETLIEGIQKGIN